MAIRDAKRASRDKFESIIALTPDACGVDSEP